MTDSDEIPRRTVLSAAVILTTGCGAPSRNDPDGETPPDTGASPTAGDEVGSGTGTDGSETSATGTATPTATTGDTAFAPGRSPWTLPDYDAGNTGYSPDASIPDSVEERWRVTGGLEIGDVLCTPIVSRDSLYLASWRTVFGLAVADGEERWTRELDHVAASFSHALAEGTLYVPAIEPADEGGALYAIDADDGSTQFATEARPASAPIVADGRVYARYVGADTLISIDRDGAVQWRLETSGASRERTRLPAPAVADGTAYVAIRQAEGAYSAVVALDAADGTEQWRTRLDDAVIAAPAAADGSMFVGTVAGTVYALDTSNGDEQWTYDADESIRDSPAVGGDMVYVSDALGTVHAVDASGGDETWRRKTDGAATTPAVTDEAVVVGGNTVLALDADTGDPRWEFDVDGAFSTGFTAPSVVGGAVASASCTKDERMQGQYHNYFHVIG